MKAALGRALGASRHAARALRSPLAFWRRLSLRTRLALVATLAVAAGIGGGVGFAYLAVRHELINEVDAGLEKQADGAKPQIIKNGWHKSALGVVLPAHPLRFGDVQGRFQLVDVDGTPTVIDRDSTPLPPIPVSENDKTVAAGSAGTIRSIDFEGQHLRVLTTPLGGGHALQLAFPLEAVDEQLSTLGWELLAAGGAGVVLAAFGGWLVTRTALRPVEELTTAAERIAATHDLAHRIPDTEPGKDELGRLAASFNSMLDAVQEATDRQRQLVADASHELRTPLTSLRTNVEVLARTERLDPVDREELVAGIMSGIDDLTDLVSDTVELARGEEQAGQFEELRWDLLIRRCVDRAATHWPKVRFETNLDECVVVGVSDRLAKAVRNLLDNAAKFSPAGGVVEVRSACSDGPGSEDEIIPGAKAGPAADRTAARAVLTVRDHGPGIPAEDLPHVFDRFYRAASARDLPGSGLGLAIVAQVAAGHGGEVTAAAADGGGAEFRLALPVER